MASVEQEKSNKIQISSSRKSLYFYVRLAKRFLQTEETIELSGLGTAINTVVSCAEILKNSEIAEITKIETSTTQVGSNSSNFTKAKIQVFLKKGAKFDEIIAQEQKEAEEKKKLKEEAESKEKTQA